MTDVFILFILSIIGMLLTHITTIILLKVISKMSASNLKIWNKLWHIEIDFNNNR